MGVHTLFDPVTQTDAGILPLPYSPAAIEMPGLKGPYGRLHFDVVALNTTVPPPPPYPVTAWNMDVDVYGRLSPEAPWHLIQKITTASPSTQQGSGTSYLCPVFPYMKAVVNTLHASAALGGVPIPGPDTWQATLWAWMED